MAMGIGIGPESDRCPNVPKPVSGDAYNGPHATLPVYRE
jgi:hypothetical protein